MPLKCTGYVTNEYLTEMVRGLVRFGVLEALRAEPSVVMVVQRFSEDTPGI